MIWPGHPDHVPPHNTDAERSAIGAMMLNLRAAHLLQAELRPEMFYLPPHRLIFEACCEIAEGLGEPDLVTVKGRLQQAGALDDCGGVEYLIECANFVPGAKNASAYAAIVKEQWQLREVESRAAAIVRDVRNPEKDLAQKLAPAASILSGLDSTHGRVVTAHAAALDQSLRVFEGVSTGIPCIDKAGHEAGATRGGITCIAADTGVGKSLFGVHAAIHAATQGRRVALVSLEMDAELVARRILQQMTGFRTCREAEDMGWAQKYDQAIRQMEAWDLKIIEEADMVEPMTVEILASRLQDLHLVKPLDIVVIDYAQLLETSRRGEEWQRMKHVARVLKKIASRLKVAMIVLSQVSPGKDGSIRLAGSGEFGKASDGVYLIERKKPKDSEIEEMSVICLKRRDGRRLNWRFMWDEGTMRPVPEIGFGGES